MYNIILMQFVVLLTVNIIISLSHTVRLFVVLSMNLIKLLNACLDNYIQDNLVKA